VRDARPWSGRGRNAGVCDLLAPIYGWFTESFGMHDLKEAKILLDALALQGHLWSRGPVRNVGSCGTFGTCPGARKMSVDWSGQEISGPRPNRRYLTLPDIWPD
jgi:hypothetical protein